MARYLRYSVSILDRYHRWQGSRLILPTGRSFATNFLSWSHKHIIWSQFFLFIFFKQRKVKLNWLLLTGLACFFHKNTNMFTFSGLRSGLFIFQFENQILCCAQSAARTFALVLINQALYTWSARAESASLHVISEIWLRPATMCRDSSARAVWSRRFGAA